MVELGSGDADGSTSELLKLVSTAQALISELLRLTDRLPSDFNHPRYAPILFDLKYLKSPEVFEEEIETNPELLALDDEFRESFSIILERFFLLFNSILQYYQDLVQYLDDLQDGVYVQSTVESVMEDGDGRQLLVEALVLHGVMLLLLEHRLNGSLREQLLVAHLRNKRSAEILNLDNLCMLCQTYSPVSASHLSSVATFVSFRQPSPSPVTSTMILVQRPEDLFARFPIPKPIVDVVITRLRGDDLYNQIRHYPIPEHRSSALASQAGCVYVLLHYSPELFASGYVMREIIDRFFQDNWIIPIFMAFTVDLSFAWERYKSAKSVLSSTLAPASVRDLCDKHYSKVKDLLIDLRGLMSDGVLTPEYVMSNTQNLLSSLRNCNVTLRWLLLHRCTVNKKIRDLIITVGNSHNVNEDVLLSLLLEIAKLEFELKRVYSKLLEDKEDRWQKCRSQAAERMQELSDFFSGSKVLSKKIKDENLQQWFGQMSIQVGSLDYMMDRNAGRKVQRMISALKEVEQFHQIEGSLVTKQYLFETRMSLQEMLRAFSVQENTLATISVVSDAAYAWGIMGMFTERIHKSIEEDPFTLQKLQCLFVKLRSLLDIPLLRISQSDSADLFSVSEYYSSELVAYVRTILDIIPINIFKILKDLVAKQAQKLHEFPSRIEKTNLRDFVQLDERYGLAKATHRLAVFSQGILAMSKTFIGVIELDPKQLLEDGIRKELAREIDNTLNSTLVFNSTHAEEFEQTLQDLSISIKSQCQLMEYFQDYVHAHGHQLWQEEFSRVVTNNTEQECNAYLKRTLEPQSAYLDIKYLSTVSTFMGRLVQQIVRLTDPSRSMYLAPMSGWFDAVGQELVGLRSFTILQSCLGPTGMIGIDRLLSFVITRSLQHALTVLHIQLNKSYMEQLENLCTVLAPPTSIPCLGVTVYKQVEIVNSAWEPWVECLAHIGQLQLLRCFIASQLRSASKVHASTVATAVEGLNNAVVCEIKGLDKNGSSGLALDENSEEIRRWLGELRKRVQLCGLYASLQDIYITADSPDYVALFLFLVTISQLSRYVLDTHLGTLASRMKKSVLDFSPLVIGFGTFLKQFHPSQTTLYVQYMSQYVRTKIESTTASSSFTLLVKNGTDVTSEVSKAVFWLLYFCKYMKISHDFLDSCLPPLMFGNPI
ncbi:hypothetical protein SUGI_0287200 [Cryptomeria japonica]|uniref:uncharacterized protein LOC131072079 isoform X1 n=1 Tax=Cryptomeria japonica TaxID=3369 RepID=UPI002408F0C0|nr:uncharacterized protein LOC131072079 isoform X1 [Cryptomeria japonica]GLJ16716.1 hypothetical protein SUGI_0287200 [Cryptomeria japonica]